VANPFENMDEIPDELWKQLNISKADFAEVSAKMREREKSVPQVGDVAPDFEIERLTADGKRSGERFELRSARGRPVALIFGSYT